MATELNIGIVWEDAGLDDQLLAELHEVPTLRYLDKDDLACLIGLERFSMPKDTVLHASKYMVGSFWALLEGELSIFKQEGKYEVQLLKPRIGETFGEVPLLTGRRSTTGRAVAITECRLLRIPGNVFWKILAISPKTREAVLADCERRFETYQAMTLHREKLVSLGTLAAGLMHELNNPGAAARRAAAQLRENITRLQHISLRMTRTPLSPEQLECLAHLQEQVLHLQGSPNYSPLERSDREEELSAWLETMHVESPWRLAPTLVNAGWSRDDIACAQSSFSQSTLSDTLNYLESLISSMQHVSTIEESITRVTDLVGAVKKYAYDDKNRQQMVDVRDSLLSTLTILNHKFHHKSLHVERSLPPVTSNISCVGAGLAQVWTNLLDNAIDAVPEHGIIRVRLWTENRWVCVGIGDNGPGIAREHWEHIFEPFYTTKEVGVGTGLGLDIAHRIVVGNFHGEIAFTSEPGATEFVVRLPISDPAKPTLAGCSMVTS